MRIGSIFSWAKNALVISKSKAATDGALPSRSEPSDQDKLWAELNERHPEVARAFQDIVHNCPFLHPFAIRYSSGYTAYNLSKDGADENLWNGRTAVYVSVLTDGTFDRVCSVHTSNGKGLTGHDVARRLYEQASDLDFISISPVNRGPRQGPAYEVSPGQECWNMLAGQVGKMRSCSAAEPHKIG